MKGFRGPVSLGKAVLRESSVVSSGRLRTLNVLLGLSSLPKQQVPRASEAHVTAVSHRRRSGTGSSDLALPRPSHPLFPHPEEPAQKRPGPPGTVAVRAR